jgi:hypothetical protein
MKIWPRSLLMFSFNMAAIAVSEKSPPTTPASEPPRLTGVAMVIVT